MDKKKLNTIIFFSILYWLLTYIFVFKKGLIFSKISAVPIIIMIGVNLLFVIFAKLLIPVFDLIIKLTGKIGTLIFGIITTAVFYLILTPISLFRRATGKKMLKLGFEKESDSYFEEWEESSDFTKQY
ncbi:MAG: hypothetical protein KAS97_10590 [Candidatus Aminicenantes bacterium]|nr:hypothetical protein [Candidatus Aminicenantes bacterium]